MVRKNKNNESNRPLTISAQDGLIDQNDFFDKQIASRDVSGYFLMRNGEFAYNKSYSNGNPWGAIKRLDKYDMGVLSTLYIVFKPTAVSSQFLLTYYATTKWYKEVAKNAAEGARNHGLLNIAPVDFFSTTLNIPNSTDEQQKIGLFFKKLDDLITLQHRKIELLKKLKRGYLQQIFPAKHQIIPKLKFNESTGDWKKYNLDKIANRYDNLRIPIAASNRIKGSTPYYGANGIQDYVDGFTHNGEYILVAEDGANDIKNYPIHYVKGKIWVNNHAHVLQGKTSIIDNKFLMYAFKNISIHPFLVGGGRTKLNSDVMMKLKLKLPAFYEQQKIGIYLDKIDNIIVLKSSELNEFTKLKQAYLQKLFP